MPRKIYDIKPPKISKKIGKDIKEFLDNEPKTVLPRRQARHKKEKKSMLAPFIYGVVIIVLVIGIYLFFKLPMADIQIWPRVDTLSFQKTITIDKSVAGVDLEKNIIPAQYFEETKTSSQDFPATGNATNEGKAAGTITVYNKFDPVTPFTLKAGTHFMADSGKLFIAPQKIVIPAAKKSGSKITPGSVQVQVQAVEGGEAYNIPPSNFSVPGLKGTAYYYSVYATSTGAMAGGYAGKVKKVTDDDVQGAKDVLVKKTIDEATTSLNEKVAAGYVLLSGAISSETVSASTPTKIGTTVQNFTYQTIVKVSAIAFKKADLDQLAKEYILSQIPEGKTLLDDSFTINYTATAVDVSGGKATLSLDFSSGVYQGIDKNSLILSVIGKNNQQITDTINNSLGEQVSRLNIKFWPFWVISAPNNQKAVNIELKFE